MSRRAGLAQFAFLIGSFLVLFAGPCDDDGGPTDNDGDADVTVVLRNDAAIPVHLFGPGEDFPCCRLESGANRQITLVLRENEQANFSAGRNGDVIDTITCTTRFAPSTDDEVTVSYDDQVGLSCDEWGPFLLRR